MKLSVALSVLILALTGVLGWKNHQQLSVAKADRAKLVEEARLLGIDVVGQTSKEGERLTKRGEREDKTAVAKKVAADFIVLVKEMEAAEGKGEPDQAMMRRVLEFVDRMSALDSAQLKVLIAEVGTAGGISDNTREGLVQFSIMTLASSNPKAALGLLMESGEMSGKEGMSSQVVSSTLSKWASDDPMGALDWVRENGEKYPDLVTTDAKRGLITGTASTDPALAFRLIGDLKMDGQEDYLSVGNIMDAAKTPEEKTAALVALRTYVAGKDQSGQEQLLRGPLRVLAQGMAQDGIESTNRWLSTANLTKYELEAFSEGVIPSVKAGDAGKWVEWMGEKLPAEKSDVRIRQLVGIWTQGDYRAAGEWLAGAESGPAKNSAISSYAETVSRYEPESAVQWALTLPAGTERQETLQKIYQNWPKADPASSQAAEAFKKQHGIK